MEKIPDGAAVILGSQTPAGFYRYAQNSDFYYLTGVEIPNAALVIDGKKKESAIFFTISENAAQEEGIGLDLVRNPVGETGIERYYPMEQFPAYLGQLVQQANILYTPFLPEELEREAGYEKYRVLQQTMTQVPWDGRLTRELEFARYLRTNYRYLQVKDCSAVIWELRLVKSPAEIDILRRAARIGVKAHTEILKAVRVGMPEYELAALFEYVCKREGAQDLAFQTVICSAQNHRFVHYDRYDRVLQDGDFVVIDAGPRLGYYGIDITTSFPVNGTFSPRQRRIYEACLAVHKACMSLYAPGQKEEVLREKARQLLIEQGYDLGDDLFQKSTMAPGFGHSVGLSIHDCGVLSWPSTLAPGMVFANEPYLVLDQENLGVRVEDTVVITATGAENLTWGIPREIGEIEAAMRAR